MQIEEFNPEVHSRHILEWLRRRELPAHLLEDLPKIGYIVYSYKTNDASYPITMGFLRRCEGNYGIIDSMITNPECSPEVRNKALNILTKRLVIAAEDLKVRKLLAYTTDKNTLERALSHGFVQLDHAVVALDLSRKSE